MVASSVFVLTALTLAGVYVKDNNKKSDDGYLIDFSALEKQAENKSKEIGEQVKEKADPSSMASGSKVEAQLGQTDMDADPDYAEISGILGKDIELTKEDKDLLDITLQDFPEEIEDHESASVSTVEQEKSYKFNADDRLQWPIVGNVLLNYSMDKTIYFATLEQYKYNPSIVIGATQGDMITAAADGKVIDVFTNEEIGNAVTVDIGSGYELTYGQLTDIQVEIGNHVKTGDIIGNVAAPTKYYSVEGSNVYFKLVKDGTPMNPLTIMK